MNRALKHACDPGDNSGVHAIHSGHQGTIERLNHHIRAAGLYGIVLVALAAACCPSMAFGQTGTLVGIVVDAESNAPLPGANVSISSTTLGASSGPDGRFTIEAVPIGPWNVAASMIGYLARTEEVSLVEPGDTASVRFRLDASVYDLDEIEVTAERRQGWDREYRLFRRLFLGESTNAEETVITNPYVLDFRRADLEFFASASAPLVIENRALGYRLRYVLNSFRWTRNPDHLRFQGEPYFEEMEPADDEERRRWDRNRATTFRGSRQHFLWALGRDRASEEGFTLERGAIDDRPGQVLPVREAGVVAGNAITGGQSRSFDYIMTFRGHILVTYAFRSKIYLFGIIPLPDTEVQRSVMRMDAHEAFIHRMGYFLGPPGALTFAGHWGNERIADLLPLDYVQIWEQYAQSATPGPRP